MVTSSRDVLPSRHCVRCGYDLHGLSSRHRCPECDVPVYASNRRRNLHFADPRWLRGLRTGLTLLMSSLGLLAGQWVLWFVIFLGEYNTRGAPYVAELLIGPFAGLSLTCAVAGLTGALFAFRRDPADREPRRLLDARSVSTALAIGAGVSGALLCVPRLFGGFAGPFVLVILALCLGVLSISAIRVFAALAQRAPVRVSIGPRALAVLVAGTEFAAFLYLVGLTMTNRTPAVGHCVATLLVVLLIAIPTSAVFYVRFLWRVLHCIRAALAAQSRLRMDSVRGG